MAEKLLYIITMIFTLSMFLILSEWRYSRRVTLYSLLPADRMIAGEGSVWPFMAALGGLALLLFGMGAVRFTRRDLSL